MLLLAGTVPVENLPLVTGRVRRVEDLLVVEGHSIRCTQGTGAMISAALAAAEYLKLEPPQAVIAGDLGQGKGSRQMYEYLIENVARVGPGVLVLHYCLPDMALTRRLCKAVERCARRPLVIADAASMYAAKAAGLATEFDVFTPDATEMAFLADPDAFHPAYIAKHLLDTDIAQTPRLVAAAYANKGAARLLLVKGAVDYVARDGAVLATVDEPDVPALEAIGGTGDTITGLVAALVCAGMDPGDAAIAAARVNRTAGVYAGATPATRVADIIGQFGPVFEQQLCR